MFRQKPLHFREEGRGGGGSPAAFSGKAGGQDMNPKRVIAGLFADNIREQKITTMEIVQRPAALAYVACYHHEAEIRMVAARILDDVNLVAVVSKSTLDFKIASRCFSKLGDGMGAADSSGRFYVATRSPYKEDRKLAYLMLMVHSAADLASGSLVVSDIHTMEEHIHSLKGNAMEIRFDHLKDAKALDALVKGRTNPFGAEEVDSRRGTFVYSDFEEIIAEGW